MRLKPRVREVKVSAADLLQWFMTIMVMLDIGLGTAILTSGPERFQTPAFKPLVDMVNGQTWFWGFSIFAAGALMAWPNWVPQVLGLWVGMCWHIAWTACFIVAVASFGNAATTGIPAYGSFTLIHVLLLTIKVLVHPKELGGDS